MDGVLKASEVESIAHVITENQKKMFMESEKHSDSDKDKVDTKYHKENPNAPLQQANKMIELLQNIDTTLRSGGVYATSIVSAFGTKAVPKTGAAIDGTKIKDVLAEVRANVAKVQSDIQKAGTADTTAMRKNLAQLENAIKALEKMDTARKDTPANVNGTGKLGEFMIKKKV